MIVVDMENPKACHVSYDERIMLPCPLFRSCCERKGYKDPYEPDIKADNCPIKGEISDSHGELKDTDAIVNTIKETYCKECNNYGGIKCRACLIDDCLACIDDAPTILEASK